MDEIFHALLNALELYLAYLIACRRADKVLSEPKDDLKQISERLGQLEQKDALYWKWFAQVHGTDSGPAARK